MQFFINRRRNNLIAARATRRLRPSVDGFESRLLLSGASIGGTVLKDSYGNGFSSGDTALANVTVDLFKAGSTTAYKSAVTNSDGDYSFTGLSSGSYSIQ